MASPIKARYCRIWVNEFDFSGQSNSIEVDISVDKQDVSTFQDAGKRYLTLDPDGKISQAGFFDEAGAGYVEQELAESILNAETIYAAALFGTQAANCPAYVAPGTNTENMKISGAIGGVIEMNGSWPAGAGMKRGVRLFAGDINAVGAQQGIDLGSAGSNGGYVWLFVQAIGGAGNITMTVQSDISSGFSSPATEATLSFSAKGGYQALMAGTVNRYVRLNCTALGGATSVTVGAIVAVNGVTM